jgi:phage terminase small subunit
MSSDTKILSRREHLAVQGVVAGKTATVALLEAGYAPTTAHKQQKAILGKDRVKRAIEQAMEEAGITTQFLARTMKEGLEAKKGVFHEGKCVAQEADHTNRHRFAKTCLQLRGELERDAADQGETWEATIFRIRGQRAQAPAIEE